MQSQQAMMLFLGEASMLRYWPGCFQDAQINVV